MSGEICGRCLRSDEDHEHYARRSGTELKWLSLCDPIDESRVFDPEAHEEPSVEDELAAALSVAYDFSRARAALRRHRGQK